MITISLTRYKESNALLFQTLHSLSMQEEIKAQVLVLDQFYDKTTEQYCIDNANQHIRFNYIVIEAKNLCYARNEAIRMCRTSILLFIDTDAVADVRWAISLTRTLQGDTVGVAGGKIVPFYHDEPIFISKYKRVQSLYSLLDLGEDECESNKVVGANFGINIQTIGGGVLFDEQFARKEGMLISGDENDFVKKVIALGQRILYTGKAIVYHQIVHERISYIRIWKRMYYQGYSKYLSSTKPVVTGFSEEKKGFLYYLFLCVFTVPWLLGYGKGMAQSYMRIKKKIHP